MKMFTTPKKQKLSNNCNTSAMIGNRYKLSNSTPNLAVHSSNNISNNNSNKRTSTAVYENGLMYGSICNADSVSKLNRTLPTRPEKEINNAGSSGLNKPNHCEINIVHSEDLAMESTALLANTLSPDNISQSDQNTTTTVHDELKQLEQDSDFLESSIYSELQFPPSMYDTDGICVDDDIVSVRITSPVSLPQTPTNTNGRTQQIKRIKRKHRTKSKCSATAAALLANQRASPTYPPRYTAIYVGSPHNQPDNRLTANHGSANAATNAFGQIVSAAAASPFLNAAPVAPNGTYVEQFQYHQQRPMITSMTTLGRHRHHRALYNVGALSTNIVTEAGLNTATSLSALPSTGLLSTLSFNLRKLCSRPSLPLVIGVLALGGVACTLVGIVLGSTGLIGHSTQYLSAALLLIGIGVSLLVISGAIWRLSLPDDVNECRCYRRMEICRNCNSPFCDSRVMTGGYLYPEFQHRPPPPSYLTSVNECGGLSFLLHSNSLRINTPPPVYQSQISLSTTTPSSNTSLSNTMNDTSTTSTNILTSIINETNHNNAVNSATDHCNTNVLQTIRENQNVSTQTLKKELNYLELD